ncbi:hypothetical protein V8F20_001335 [Naviculisporaceae sp. PSN 640]
MASSTEFPSSPETPLYAKLLAQPPDPQQSCPLFNRFPAEIRQEIFALALSDFPDPAAENQYSAQTIYTRPSFFAPRKSDLRLLRTCRAIYAEAWHLPFVMREQTHWITSDDRAPAGHSANEGRNRLFRTAEWIMKSSGLKEVEIESLRVFAQMWAIERGDLGSFLWGCGYRGIMPRRFTLTIRHTDWWWWESDRPLRFEGLWLSRLKNDYLPSSIREIHIELESVERKKEQIDAIAKQMAEKWYFVRKDGVALFPDVTGKSVEIDRWSGSSTWQGRTWTRDESAPGRIDYYIATVVFRPEVVVKRRGGAVNPDSVAEAESGGPFPSAAKMRLAWVPPPREGAEDGSEEDFSDSDSDSSNENLYFALID